MGKGSGAQNTKSEALQILLGPPNIGPSWLIREAKAQGRGAAGGSCFPNSEAHRPVFHLLAQTQALRMCRLTLAIPRMTSHRPSEGGTVGISTVSEMTKAEAREVT